MKTNHDQRRMMSDHARHARHEMFADDVIALICDLEEALEMLKALEPFIDTGPLKNKVITATRR